MQAGHKARCDTSGHSGKRLHDSLVSMARRGQPCLVVRRSTQAICDRHARPGRHQSRHGIAMSAAGRQVQRAVAGRIERVDAGVFFQQQRDAFRRAGGGREVQRRPSELIACSDGGAAAQ